MIMAVFNFSDVTVEDFKHYFDRHFPFAPADDPDNKEYIRDRDIELAFKQAQVNFNRALWSDPEQAKVAYLFLTAHYLCMDLQMAQAGINSIGHFIVSQKTVGEVSAIYSIPYRYTQSAYTSYLTGTQFGMKYLSLLLPRITGAVGLVKGTITYE